MAGRSSANCLRRRASRIGTAAIAALCLGAQLSNLTHLALARHVTCAEHGEVVDAPELEHAVALGAEVAWHREHGASVSSGGGLASQAHEHCSFAEDRNAHGFVVRAATASSCGAQPTDVAPLQSRSDGLSPSALRLLAPKTSPPV